MKVNAIQLLKNNRFDIPAKHLYARYRDAGYDTTFGEDVYKSHLDVWNGFDELDNSNKNTYESFKSTFDNILDSISSDGFDSSKGTLPVYENFLINGSHRLTASILYNKEVETHEALENEGQLDCSSSMFASKGMTTFNLDAMATEYVRLVPNTLVVTLFPSATHDSDKIQSAWQLLNKTSDVVYVKSFDWKNNAPLNLIRQIYLGEEWGLGWSHNFAGFARKAELCFTTSAPVLSFLIVPHESVDIVQLKESIRTIFGIGKHSCHINDTHEETMRIARLYYNENSIHHMNNARHVHYNSFQCMFDYYKNYIRDNNLDPENYCVTASSVLSLYGLREGEDLDYLHRDLGVHGHYMIHSHNEELSKYTMGKDEILFNPKNHFWYDGVKVASLGVIRELKEKRNEPKDVVDIQLIKEVS
tara:strand:- start:2953 stop:4203 length:1251 start_codon:yes stop_codon:yes gene_type:complete